MQNGVLSMGNSIVVDLVRANLRRDENHPCGECETVYTTSLCFIRDLNEAFCASKWKEISIVSFKFQGQAPVSGLSTEAFKENSIIYSVFIDNGTIKLSTRYTGEEQLAIVPLASLVVENKAPINKMMIRELRGFTNKDKVMEEEFKGKQSLLTEWINKHSR